MFQRLLIWGVRRYVGGSSRSWVFASLALLLVRLVRSTTGRREVVDVGSIKPGDKIVIEHLPISHGRQIKQMKAEQHAASKAAKAEKRVAKQYKKAAKAEKRAVKQTRKSARKSAGDQVGA